jgi:hypothetical protein
LLASGLGLARRTATAAATAVEAAAAVWSQEDSSSVDLRPDLPDYSLRMRWVQWVGGSGLSWGEGEAVGQPDVVSTACCDSTHLQQPPSIIWVCPPGGGGALPAVC